MGMRLEGDIDSLMGMIRQTGDKAKKGVALKMQNIGNEMFDLAREYAPLDFGNLEDAIKINIDRGDINRRIQVMIWVDGDMPAHDGRPIGRYALLMHEGLAPWGSGEWHAREGTEKKGPQAGGRYMARAFEKYKDDIEVLLAEASKDAIR